MCILMLMLLMFSWLLVEVLGAVFASVMVEFTVALSMMLVCFDCFVFLVLPFRAPISRFPVFSFRAARYVPLLVSFFGFEVLLVTLTPVWLYRLHYIFRCFRRDYGGYLRGAAATHVRNLSLLGVRQYCGGTGSLYHHLNVLCAEWELFVTGFVLRAERYHKYSVWNLEAFL